MPFGTVVLRESPFVDALVNDVISPILDTYANIRERNRPREDKGNARLRFSTHSRGIDGRIPDILQLHTRTLGNRNHPGNGIEHQLGAGGEPLAGNGRVDSQPEAVREIGQ